MVNVREHPEVEGGAVVEGGGQAVLRVSGAICDEADAECAAPQCGLIAGCVEGDGPLFLA